MAVYYLGNPCEKRKKLLASSDAVYIDNDEVLATYFKGNKYYFIVGKAAFLDFTVWEYLSYSKSLELRRPLRMDEAKELLSSVGLDLPLSKRLKKLDPITLKAIKLVTKIKADTTRICLNLDGIAFTRSKYKKLGKIIAALSDYQVIVSVSDVRFVPKEGVIEWFLDSLFGMCKIKILKESKSAIKLA